MSLLSSGAAAKRLGVTTSTIRRWIAAGLLKAVKHPGPLGHYRIPEEALSTFHAKHNAATEANAVKREMPVRQAAG